MKCFLVFITAPKLDTWGIGWIEHLLAATWKHDAKQAITLFHICCLYSNNKECCWVVFWCFCYLHQSPLNLSVSWGSLWETSATYREKHKYLKHPSNNFTVNKCSVHNSFFEWTLCLLCQYWSSHLWHVFTKYFNLIQTGDKQANKKTAPVFSTS